jgi:signal peptidase I
MHATALHAVPDAPRGSTNPTRSVRHHLLVALASNHLESGMVSADPRTKLATEVVRETLEECERLLDDAEVAAEELRRAGEHDAAKIRREAVRANAKLGDDIIAAAEQRARIALEEAEARVRDMVLAAQARLAEADALAAEARAQRAELDADAAELDGRRSELDAGAAELDARRASLRDATRISAGLVLRTMNDAEVWADRRRTQAEDEAVELLDRAWQAAGDVQEELLAEAEEEAAALLEAAHRDAERLRRDAEETAERARRAADGYAEDVLYAALQAQPVLPDGSLAPRPGLLAGARDRLARARVATRRVLQVAGALALVLLTLTALRAMVGEPFAVSALSMSPTIDDGDRILVNKVPYRFDHPHRGDVVVVEAPVRAGGTGWAWPVDEERFVKRVVGMPGETVEGRDGRVLVNGIPLDEPYLPAGTSTRPFPAVSVPDGSYFLLGDHRLLSVDSRSFGPVPGDAVVGRADAIIWPLGSLGRL